MTGPLYAIGRFCSRHHYPVIAAWIVLAIALRRDRPGRRQQDQRKPDPAGHRLDQGDRTARRQPARTGLRQQPAGARSAAGQKLTDAEVRGRGRGNREAAGSAAATSTPRSARSARRARTSSARTRRSATSRSSSAIGPGEIDEEEARTDPRRRRARRAQAGPEHRDRRLRRPAALQARDRDQRGDRPRRGGDHPPLRLRHRDGDDAADRLRGDRPRLRALDHPPARARARGAGGRLDPGDDDRPRRRDRLRAVHRHPPQTAARPKGWSCASRSPARPRPPAAPSSSPASRS